MIWLEIEWIDHGAEHEGLCEREFRAMKRVRNTQMREKYSVAILKEE